MIRTWQIAATLVALAVLVGCGSNGEPADPPAAGLQATAGDGVATVTWTDDTSVEYWLFVSTDPALTTQNFETLTDIRVIRSARSPYVLCGYPDGRTLYLTMNGRRDSGPGGPGTPTISTTLRAAGAAWTAGTAPAVDFNAVSYAPITTCSAASLPTGTFVAVGPGAALASSADGVTFTARTPPAGFTTDLSSAAAFTSNINNPANPGIELVAVGAGGASIVSTDGVTWTIGTAFNAAAPNLHAVAVNVGTFIAVGDGGAAQNSVDGVAWTAHTSNVTNTLRGIGCSGDRCIAVGDAGSLTRTLDGGNSWTAQSITGAPALKAIAYGNFNNNVGSTTVSINRWVAVGDGGTALYSTDGGLTWTATTVAGAANFVTISYLTRFVAIDSASNAFFSVDGQTWTGPVATGLAVPRSVIGNGVGFVAVGTGGGTVSSF